MLFVPGDTRRGAFEGRVPFIRALPNESFGVLFVPGDTRRGGAFKGRVPFIRALSNESLKEE